MASTALRILRSRCHFEVLALPRAQTTSAAIKTAYLAQAQAVHPDHLDHPDAPKAFAKLKASYEALASQAGRTSHLLRRPARPAAPGGAASSSRRVPRAGAFLERMASGTGLCVAAAVFLAAELVRLAVADDAPAAVAEPVAAPASREPTRRPRAPAFASNEGEAYEGYSQEHIRDRVQDGIHRARARRRAATTAPAAESREPA